MAIEPERPAAGGGGAATSAGILFQQQVGALVGSWLLTQRPFDRRFNLGQVTPVWMRFETAAPVDDILVSTSAGGFAAIQAKTTVSLSRKSSSQFSKTVSQFVRHWLECRDGDGSLHWNRPLDPQRDRLVLAVGPQAPATIRETLPTALRLQSQPGGGELNAAQQQAFDHFEACVEQAWAKSTADDYDPAVARTLAALVSILTFDPAGLERTAIVAALGSAVTEPADGMATLTSLEAVCGELMAQRGGIDLGTLRQKLMGRGILLPPPQDFHQDIAKLQSHSKEIAGALKRYENIETVDGDPVSLVRECQDAIREAALGGHLLIIGEPGAGKSGVLNALARDLRTAGNDVLQLAVDQYSVETLEGLQNELGIDHGLIETLDAWDGTEPGWLIVDALDATRGGHGEGIFRRLIEQVMERDGRWKVIASIRTFDLRMGLQFRTLFKGIPPSADLQEQEFQAVRHVRVPSWSQTDFAQLLDQAPKLAAALDDAPAALLKLAEVPFNTRLLSDLVKDDAVTAGFSHIASQAELLQLYWEHRVEVHGAPAQACIQRIAEAMVEARALRAPFDAAAGHDPAMLDSLEHEGVLISNDNRRWIQFRHHLMFDFAAARVLLDPDDLIDGTLKFGKSEARGLMLAPALAFVLREVWNRETDRGAFWTAAANLLADRECDPVIRSATGRICTEYPSSVDDMTVLARHIASGNELSIRAFIHISGALAIRLEDYPDTPLAPWVRLVRDIASNVAPVSGAMRFLLSRLISRVEGKTDRASLGTAARALLAFAFTPEAPGNLVPSAVDFVANTYTTDPTESRSLLARIFESKRLDAFAAEEVPAVCRNIEAIATPDPEFGELIYRKTYDFEVTDRQETSISVSQILPLTSNARRDYGMARHALGEFIEKFLQIHPDHAVSAIVNAVEAYVEKKRPHNPEILDTEIHTNTHVVRLREDRSDIWAHDPDRSYGHDARTLIVKLTHYLRTAEASAALDIAERLVATSSLAIFWSRLFLAASERNDALIDLMLPIAMCEKFFTLQGTRKYAVEVVAQGYGRLSLSDRESFESAVPEFDYSLFNGLGYPRAIFEPRLFGAIGSAKLATARARAVAGEWRGTDDAQNGASEPYHLTDDIDRNLPANQELIKAIERIKEFLGEESDANDGSFVSLQASLDAMESLTAGINREAQDPRLIIDAEDQIARGVKRIIGRKLVPGADDDEAGTRFLKLLDLLTTSDAPPLHDDTEANFERNPFWETPAPRVDAAEAALDLTLQRPDLYSTLEPVIDKLLGDEHPAVRSRTACGLVRIWDIDREGFWRRLSDRLANEPNQEVVDHVTADVLGKLLYADPDRMEPLALTLLDRFTGEAERQTRMQNTVADLLAILWVTYERPATHAILRAWIADVATYHSALGEVLVTLRSTFTAGLNGEESTEANGCRHRSRALVHEIVAATNNGLENLFRIETPTEQQKEQWHNHAQLLDTACLELYFASGAGRDNNDTARVIEDDALAVFFTEIDPILESIGDFATPHTVHYLLKLLEYLLPFNPARAFDLTAHALQCGGRRTRYQVESMGVELLVRLVGVFLADHRELFENDDRRAALIGCLEMFMDAGWPAAQRLLYRLPEFVQ